jgi:hypothetical protein
MIYCGCSGGLFGLEYGKLSAPVIVKQGVDVVCGCSSYCFL